MVGWEILEGDALERLREMPNESVDAVVTDPPYGLEFMGKDWDRLDGEGWRSGGGFSKPGIGDRPTPWASYGNGDTANATCATCGGRMRGANRCRCDEPEWRVKGRPLSAAGVDSRQAQGRKMQGWHERWAVEALRVLKPGGHLLAFGGTRTYHRLACAIEDAGFEIRDCVVWLYGSGFPKSLDVSKAIDKAAGVGREVTPTVPLLEGRENQTPRNLRCGVCGRARVSADPCRCPRDSGPQTPEAERWDGWGTALKPGHEPIVVARKPLAGTVAANVLAHGTGALNIDGCRIENTPEDRESSMRSMSGERMWRRSGITGAATFDPGCAAEPMMDPAGRWPANVVLDEEAARMLDEQSGELTSGAHSLDHGRSAPRLGHGGTYGDHAPPTAFTVEREANRGGASRFYYCAKASRAERNAGLNGFEEKMPHDNAGHVHADGRAWDVPGSHSTARANHHPTVKPVELMRWLVRLVTPPGGIVLDPFAGSGPTGIAATLEGFRFVGIEREGDYTRIARARIAWWAENPAGLATDTILAAAHKRPGTQQLGLLDTTT